MSKDASSRMSRRAIERIADNRILEAIDEGQFDDLPGYGKPIPGIDEPYDPNWWIKQWMNREKLAKELGEGLRTLRKQS